MGDRLRVGVKGRGVGGWELDKQTGPGYISHRLHVTMEIRK